MAAGVADMAAKRFLRAALISANWLVVAAVRWYRAVFLVEDAAASMSN